MRTYLISYDLVEDRSRNRLSSEIMRLGQSWARPLANTWYLRTEASEADLHRLLRPWLDADDGLLIQPVRDEAVLLNTALRWFRQRGNGLLSDVATNIVAFPSAAERQLEGAKVEASHAA